MNRRTFIGAASALVSSWWLPRGARFQQQLDLSMFCDDCTTRWNMSRPFEQGDWVYATDGRIAVRALPKLCTVRSDEEGRLPPAELLSWPGDVGGWAPLSVLDRKACPSVYNTANCPTCFGKGRIGPGVRDCDNHCEGSYVMWADEPECRECGPKCSGYMGGLECSECDGTGGVDYRFVLGELELNPGYIGRLSRLPGVEIRVGDLTPIVKASPQKIQYGKPDRALQVRFDGGHGLLMPMLKD